MQTEHILDQLLMPRPGGSDNLDAIARYLADSLASTGAVVSEFPFTATPHGFALVWTTAVIMMAVYAVCLVKRHYVAAALVPVLLAAMLLLEFELLVSTVSALSNSVERNIIGMFPGSGTGPTLVFSAHYDTATHFGDHFSWGRWGKLQGPATGLAIGFPLLALWLHRRGMSVPLPVALAVIPLAAAPFVAMFWFQAVGPLVRTPSIGAIDNGGSVAALLRLAEELQKRPPRTGNPVKIVFFAAEEERTLGSWAYAKSLIEESRTDQSIGTVRGITAINLESVGTGDTLAYIPEDGFALRRYTSSQAIIDFVNDGARAVYGKPLAPRALPFGVLTDGRSFLAHGIDAITLRSYDDGEFPRGLHSVHDSRDRLSIAGIEASVTLLKALVDLADNPPPPRPPG